MSLASPVTLLLLACGALTFASDSGAAEWAGYYTLSAPCPYESCCCMSDELPALVEQNGLRITITSAVTGSLCTQEPTISFSFILDDASSTSQTFSVYGLEASASLNGSNIIFTDLSSSSCRMTTSRVPTPTFGVNPWTGKYHVGRGCDTGTCCCPQDEVDVSQNDTFVLASFRSTGQCGGDAAEMAMFMLSSPTATSASLDVHSLGYYAVLTSGGVLVSADDPNEQCGWIMYPGGTSGNSSSLWIYLLVAAVVIAVAAVAVGLFLRHRSRRAAGEQAYNIGLAAPLTGGVEGFSQLK